MESREIVSLGHVPAIDGGPTVYGGPTVAGRLTSDAAYFATESAGSGTQ